MNEYSLLIDGKMVPGDQTMPVLNPATEEVLAQCPRAFKDQLDAAVAAAKAAYPAWAAISLYGSAQNSTLYLSEYIDLTNRVQPAFLLNPTGSTWPGVTHP